MRLYAILALLLLSCMPFASFALVAHHNGSNPDEVDDYYKFSQPTGLLILGDKLYVADSGRGFVYVLNKSAGTNQTVRYRVAGGISGSNALTNPLRMTYDDGLIYIADGIGRNIRTYVGEGSQISTWNTGSNMQKPSAVAVGSQYLYITDLEKKKLFLYSRETKSYSSIGIETGLSDGKLSAPADIEIYDSKFFVSDSEKGLIFVYDPDLTFLYAIGRGKGGVTLSSPRGFDIVDDRIYVADSSSQRIVVFTMDGYPIEILDSTTPWGNFSYPEDVIVDNNALYVADTGNRKLKVFEIIPSGGNDTVQQLIDSATSAVSDLNSLQVVAQKIDAPFNASSANFELQSAKSDYENFLFSSAASLAQQAIDSSTAAKEVLAQDIDVKIRQIAKQANETVLPYRGTSSAELMSKLSQFDNRMSGIYSKLGAKAYGPAADSVLELSDDADAIVLAAEGKTAEDEQKKQQQIKASLDSQADFLMESISKLEQDAEKYRQEVNLSNSERLIAEAKVFIDSEDFESANHSLGLAAFEVESYSSSMDETIEEIEEALSNISVFELELSVKAESPSLIKADLSSEMRLIAQAKETVYSNPQLARAMAQQATESARPKVREAQALSVAIAALLLMLAVIGLLSLVFYIHLKRRKKARQKHSKKKEKKGKRKG